MIAASPTIDPEVPVRRRRRTVILVGVTVAVRGFVAALVAFAIVFCGADSLCSALGG